MSTYGVTSPISGQHLPGTCDQACEGLRKGETGMSACGGPGGRREPHDRALQAFGLTGRVGGGNTTNSGGQKARVPREPPNMAFGWETGRHVRKVR